MGCDLLEADLTETHPLRYLSQNEIEVLVESLDRHRCLGRLATASHEERVQAFLSAYDRQLLVVLHEATHGKPLEDILVDEYSEIRPESARLLYLSVCVLNRLNVSVRAGLISRVYGISFTHFREKLFRPLEHVVQVKLDPITRDYLYAARHSLIADIVFQRILTSPNERYDQYVRLIGNMNLSYETDRTAFLQLMRARTLLELFPDHDAVVQLFKVAAQVAPEDAFLLHQRGIYEMRRPNGSLSQAADYLNRALALASRDLTIRHSLAELELARADASRTTLERDRHRQKARQLAAVVCQDPVRGAYGYHTLLKLGLARLTELLQTAASDGEIDLAIQEIETQLERGQARFPRDNYLMAAEADFSRLLQDEDRALSALRRAFQLNRRSPFIAGSLAKLLRDRGQPNDAETVLAEALQANPGERWLHAALAVLLHSSSEPDIPRILHHLRRSFTPGDANYRMQFLYAAYLYMSETDQDRTESNKLFATLRAAPIPYDLRRKIGCTYGEAGTPKLFTGRVRRLEPTYGFVQRDGPGDSIYMSEDFSQDDWPQLVIGQSVRFRIGFNFFGPIALEVRPNV
jgi:Flp pilus assembly protein TadD